MDRKIAERKPSAVLPRHAALEKRSGRAGTHNEPAAVCRIGVVEAIVQIFGADGPIASRFVLDPATDHPALTRIANLGPD